MRIYLAKPDSGTAIHEAIWGWIGLAALTVPFWLPLERLGLLACPLKGATGIPCFLCGGTRSFWAAAHLDFVSAWNFNPLGLLLFGGLLLYLPYALGSIAFRWPRPRLRLESGGERAVLRSLIAGGIGANWIFLLLR